MNDQIYLVEGYEIDSSRVDEMTPPRLEWKSLGYATGSRDDILNYFESSNYMELKLTPVIPTEITRKKVGEIGALREAEREIRTELGNLPCTYGWHYEKAQQLEKSLERVSSELEELVEKHHSVAGAITKGVLAA